jgi:predicted DNA-binding transcriptional regulator AlpA
MQRRSGGMWETKVDDVNSIRVLSEPELLRVLGLSDRTFDRMKQRGDAPPKTQLSVGRVGYRVCDVEEWLDKKRRQVTEEAAR